MFLCRVRLESTGAGLRFAALAVAALMACEVAPLEAGELEKFFEKEIRPILVERCHECHSGELAENNLRLDTRPGMLLGGKAGAAIVPGKPDESLIIKAIGRISEELAMPPDEPLSAKEIALLEKWIRDGAVWPGSEQHWKETHVDPASHWAYQPLSSAEPPEVPELEWSQTAIDRFVRRKQMEAGCQPIQLAGPSALLRRIHYDLTGLPPTEREVRDFLADPSKQRYHATVMELLASPHYGERWGRHWLDVVRFADTTGCNSDFPIREAYLYRDYVIEALNHDMPFDQFVQEQLAGDLLNEEDNVPNVLRGFARYVDRPPIDTHKHPGMLPDPATPQLDDMTARDAISTELGPDHRRRYIATGYIAISRRFGSEVSRYPVHLTIDDTIDNVGKAFLGLSLSCARCHDHKFDAVSQQDYYSLYGIFASTRYSWPGIELAPAPRDMVPLISPGQYTALRQGAEEKTKEERQKAFDLWARWQVDWEYFQDNPKSHQADHKFWNTTRDLYLQLKEEGLQLQRALAEHDRAYGVVDADLVGDAAVHLKGDPETLGPVVPRGMPQILGGKMLRADVATRSSGRLQLARWLTDRNSIAGQLLARVMANRIWQGHFGYGLVRTPNDFGVRGTPPTHPELLDYLARRLIESGWSLKSLHREIMLSRVYRLGSTGKPASDTDSSAAAEQQLDPANRWLWRQTRRRMDAESLRDALLALSGKLDTNPPGEPHPFPPETEWKYTQHKPFSDVYEHNHRSVYLMRKRMKTQPYFTIFDGADTNATTARRDQSVTSTQSLFMLNNPLVHETAGALADATCESVCEPGQPLDTIYLRLFARFPTQSECKLLEESMVAMSRSRSEEEGATDSHTKQDWAGLVRALLRTNEFMYID